VRNTRPRRPAQRPAQRPAPAPAPAGARLESTQSVVQVADAQEDQALVVDGLVEILVLAPLGAPLGGPRGSLSRGGEGEGGGGGPVLEPQAQQDGRVEHVQRLRVPAQQVVAHAQVVVHLEDQPRGQLLERGQAAVLGQGRARLPATQQRAGRRRRLESAQQHAAGAGGGLRLGQGRGMCMCQGGGGGCMRLAPPRPRAPRPRVVGGDGGDAAGAGAGARVCVRLAPAPARSALPHGRHVCAAVSL
jgi:hypothetical protein